MQRLWRDLWHEPRHGWAAWLPLLVGFLFLIIAVLEAGPSRVQYLLGACVFRFMGVAEVLPAPQWQLAGLLRLLGLTCASVALVGPCASSGGLTISPPVGYG